MKYTISKEFHFSASHKLEHLPEDHPCHNLHGHNYVITIGFASNELNEDGFVIDFRQLDGIKKFIDGCWDHKHLNDVFEGGYTTSENIAQWMYIYVSARFKHFNNFNIDYVTVSENPKTQATYRRE